MSQAPEAVLAQRVVEALLERGDQRALAGLLEGAVRSDPLVRRELEDLLVLLDQESAERRDPRALPGL